MKKVDRDNISLIISVFKNTGFSVKNLSIKVGVKVVDGKQIYIATYSVVTTFICKQIQLELYCKITNGMRRVYVYDYEVNVHKDLEDDDGILFIFLSQFKDIFKE